MDWARDFYTTTGHWWGPAESGIGVRDRKRAATLERLAPGAKRILELDAGYCNTAAACAELGFDVVAVEISERITYAEQFAARAYRGSLEIVPADFFHARFVGQFEAVTYWNGFGVGTDVDQRRLLKRISGEWLTEGGVALIDIANPLVWARWAGREEQRVQRPEQGYKYDVSERVDFDPVRCRFIDTWWRTESTETPMSQSIRCYTPADFTLLLEGTGLKLEQIEVAGQPIDLATVSAMGSLVWGAHEYLAKLGRDGRTP